MKWIAVSIVVLGVIIGLFFIQYPTRSYRYQLTIEAVVDGNLVQGSGVIEVIYRSFPQFLGASSGGS